MQISVIGSNDSAGKKALEMAEELGKEIATAGVVLICGGRFGVMEAVCKGAKSKNGITVGILPGSTDDSNDFLDIKIPTGLGNARNSIVAKSGDVIIAICGSVGTLIEILYGIVFGKTIILLEGTKGVVDEFHSLENISEIKEKIEISGAKILRAKTPKEAVKYALDSIKNEPIDK